MSNFPGVSDAPSPDYPADADAFLIMSDTTFYTRDGEILTRGDPVPENHAQKFWDQDGFSMLLPVSVDEDEDGEIHVEAHSPPGGEWSRPSGEILDERPGSYIGEGHKKAQQKEEAVEKYQRRLNDTDENGEGDE